LRLVICSGRGIVGIDRYEVLGSMQHNRLLHTTILAKFAVASAHTEKCDDNGEKNASPSARGSTVTPGEVEKFERMASSWWNPDGQMKELLSMNRLR